MLTNQRKHSYMNLICPFSKLDFCTFPLNLNERFCKKDLLFISVPPCHQTTIITNFSLSLQSKACKTSTTYHFKTGAILFCQLQLFLTRHFMIKLNKISFKYSSETLFTGEAGSPHRRTTNTDNILCLAQQVHYQVA